MKNNNSIHQRLEKCKLPPEEVGGAFWADCMHTALQNSSIIFNIFRGTFGADSPDKEVCPMSFVTKKDLENCKVTLRLQPGMRILDLACGGGGPGLWLARECGVNLVGVDFSIKALEQAAHRAIDFGIAENIKYCHGSMKATGLESESFDAVVSFDALWAATDIRAVLKEVRRILHSQGRFVFTTWENIIPGTGKPTNSEFHSLLQDSGFRVETYEETPNWESLQREVYKQWIIRQNELARELGVSVAGMLVNEAIWSITTLDDGTDRLSHSRRVFVVNSAV